MLDFSSFSSRNRVRTITAKFFFPFDKVSIEFHAGKIFLLNSLGFTSSESPNSKGRTSLSVAEIKFPKAFLGNCLDEADVDADSRSS